MNISDMKSDPKSSAYKREREKREKRRRLEKEQRRKNTLRRLLCRRGRDKRFDPRNEIPPTLTPLFDSVYAQIVALITNPIGPGHMHSRHVTRFFRMLESGDVTGVAGIISLYSGGGIFSSEWTFFNKAIRIRKPNYQELRISECAARLYDTFYRLLAERLVKNRKKILQLKKDNLSTFRKVIFSLVASVVALIWLLSVLLNPA